MNNTDKIIQLYSDLGDNLANDKVLSDAKMAILVGCNDVVKTLINTSEELSLLRRDVLDSIEQKEYSEKLRNISFNLRLIAHRLNREFGDKADDSRLLHLVGG